MREITQSALPHTPWLDPALSRLPGMRPVEGSWITVDDAYAEQMAERARLHSTARDRVEAILPGSEDALEELKTLALEALPLAFHRAGRMVTRPDGKVVTTDGTPFAVLNALLQEDLLILEKRAGEHVLIAGLLCFPSHWTLSEKIGRGLTRIHAPVADYDADLARRVQRLFDRVQPGRPMWRANLLPHDRAILHRPHPEGTPRPPEKAARFIRSERQTVLRLPATGAVLFAVHTTIVPVARLDPIQRRTLPFEVAE
jgi:hypothetical protein